jgi:MFS family permease
MTLFLKKEKNWKDFVILKGVNPVVKFFTISDFIVISGFGLVSPIFAVFISDNIKGGNLEVVGIAGMIYLLTRSLLQIPIAQFIDKIKGEKDDFLILFLGSIAYSFIFLLYIIVTTPTQLYFIQFLYGLISALTLPGWYAIFTRHIDKRHEGMEWGVYTTFTDLGAAAAAGMGGFFASRFGFTNLFIVASIVSFVGALFLWGAYGSLKKKTIFDR